MVTRYALHLGENEHKLIENEEGGYVLYSDFKNLEVENRNLKFENGRLWKLVDELQASIKQVSGHEYTSARVASIAARLLQDENTPDDVKTIAASVLTQARDNPGDADSDS